MRVTDLLIGLEAKMVQEYLNLDQAAEVLGIAKAQLIQMAQRREIRAFADRGSWKFRKQDIDEHARQGGIGSGAEIVFGDLDDAVDSDEEPGSSDQILLAENLGEQDPGGSGVRVIGMDEQGRTPSDSDVRLVPEQDSEDGSDSDVKLVAGSKPPSDSDVKLVAEGDSGASDSDVKIKGPAPTDSDVRLEEARGPRQAVAPEATQRLSAVSDEGQEELAIQSESAASEQDSEFELGPGPEKGSDFELSAESEAGPPGDSDMTLAMGDNVAVVPEPAEQAPPGPADSDLTAQAPSSSGLDLSSPADSGIALNGAGSGINLSPQSGTEQQQDMSETDFDVPLLESDDEFELSDDSSADTAQLDDSDFELSDFDKQPPAKEQDSAQVIALEDEELTDEGDPTKLGSTPVTDEEWEEDLEVEEVGEATDKVEVAEGVLPEEAEDTTAPPLAPISAAQSEWGGVIVGFLVFTTIVLILHGVIMLDLVQTMWGGYSSPLLEYFAGMLPGNG